MMKRNLCIACQVITNRDRDTSTKSICPKCSYEKALHDAFEELR